MWQYLDDHLGGNRRDPVRFTGLQTEIINCLADCFIPPRDGYPPASSVNLAEFFGWYVTPAGDEPKYFPFASERTFKRNLDSLGKQFVSMDPKQREERVSLLEERDPPFFDRILSLTYYGYYSRPEVVYSLRKQLDAARHYHGPPQPEGYRPVMTESLQEAGFELPQRGSFTPTTYLESGGSD